MNLALRINSLFIFALASTLTPGISAEPADDPERLAARTLGYAGVEAYEAGDFQTASEQLDKAYAVLRVPSLGLWSARALRKQGRLVEAAARLREVATLELGSVEVEVQRSAQQDAAADLRELEPLIPRLVIQVIGMGDADVEVTLDGRAVPMSQLGASLPLNPGGHTVQARLDAQQSEQQLSVAEGEQQLVVLELEAEPPKPIPVAPPAEAEARPIESAPDEAAEPRVAEPAADSESDSFVSDTLPWVLIGVGGAGVVAGSVSLGMALDTRGEIDSNPDCEGLRCRPSESGLVDRYNTLGTVSGVGLIVGGVIAASGVTLLFLDLDGAEQTTALHVGPTMLWVSREF